MLRVRSWQKWQRGIISTVRKSRESRRKAGQDVDMDAPLSMQHIAVATTWDHDFVDTFGALVGQRNAETYFLRFLQYVALHDGFTGICPVERDEFGDLVLSRRRDKVTRKEGEKVYDALIAARLADPFQFESRSVTHPVTSNGMQPETRSESSRARVPGLSCLGPDSPPPSCPSAGAVASPQETANGNADTPMSPADRAVFEVLFRKREKMLRADRTEAESIREELKAGQGADRALAFIDRLSPQFLTEVGDCRRVYRMAENGRKEAAKGSP